MRLSLSSASTLVRHLVQQVRPSEAFTILAPAHPVHGIPQFGQEILAIYFVGFFKRKLNNMFFASHSSDVKHIHISE
jgi:hypothetical protein